MFETRPRKSVVCVEGQVVARSAETVNPQLPTGEIEIRVEKAEVLSEAQELPLPVFGEPDYPEEIRLKYRYLDLRRESLHKNIMLRTKVIASLRKRMIEQGFTEFSTPILTASSPEGARDYLVPSRVHRESSTRCPRRRSNSKQLLMVAGFDRYFQIAPCFRDEDARADRAPGEFYQLDLEMSFVTQEDVFTATEPVMHDVFEEFSEGRWVSPAPFRRIPYKESMLKYGSDKPDLRNPIEIVDVTDIFASDEVEFKAFKGKTVRAIPAPGAGAQPRSFFDKLNDWGAQGIQGAGPGLHHLRRRRRQRADREIRPGGLAEEDGRARGREAGRCAVFLGRSGIAGGETRGRGAAAHWRGAWRHQDGRLPLLLDRRFPDV